MLFRQMSGPARIAAWLWLFSLLAAGGILLVACLKPSAARASVLAHNLPDEPLGLALVLAVLAGAIVFGVVGALVFTGEMRAALRRRG